MNISRFVSIARNPALMKQGLQAFQCMPHAQRKQVLQLASTAAFMGQNRGYQSPYTPGRKVSAFDMMTGVYDDPQYALDLKPVEFRDGQANSYNIFGAMAAIIPSVFAIFIAVFSLAWYSMFDPDANLFRNNPHPFFEIRSGREVAMGLNPAFFWMYPLSPGNHLNERTAFMAEIEDAIQRRKGEAGLSTTRR